MIKDIRELEENMKEILKEVMDPHLDILTFKDSTIGDENVTNGDMLNLLDQTMELLLPLETHIKIFELQLKVNQINLKQSPEYEEYKTIKAKEEQSVLDTSICKELLITLKGIRDHLRYVQEYSKYSLDMCGVQVEGSTVDH